VGPFNVLSEQYWALSRVLNVKNLPRRMVGAGRKRVETILDPAGKVPALRGRSGCCLEYVFQCELQNAGIGRALDDPERR
jgi:hypothetical protein